MSAVIGKVFIKPLNIEVTLRTAGKSPVQHRVELTIHIITDSNNSSDLKHLLIKYAFSSAVGFIMYCIRLHFIHSFILLFFSDMEPWKKLKLFLYTC